MKLIQFVTASICLSILLSACAKNKYIFKGNFLQQRKGDDQDTLQTWKVIDNGFKAKIVDKGDYLIIKPVSGSAPTLRPQADQKVVSPTGSAATIILEARNTKPNTDSYKYFPDAAEEVHSRLVYFDSRFMLQALTLPIKIRVQPNSVAQNDSFPNTLETAVNVGLSPGWKFNMNFFKSKKDLLFNQNTNRLSLATGFIFGLGAVDLKKSNTRYPSIKIERKAPAFTYGGFVVIGINTINIGYATGIDQAGGTSSESWIYQGKRWHAIIIAFDLIK